MIDYGEYSDGGTDEPLRKYVLFAGRRYYPSEGVGDLRATSDDIAELRQMGVEWIEEEGLVWWQICDRTTLKILEQGDVDD